MFLRKWVAEIQPVRPVTWIPAFAGMTGKTAGMTRGIAGMTRAWRFVPVIPVTVIPAGVSMSQQKWVAEIQNSVTVMPLAVILAEAGIQASFPRRWESRPF